MRFLILKDLKITDAKLDELRSEFTDLVKGATGLSPVFYVQEHDFTTVPTETDADGDYKPTKAYMTALMNDVHKKYGTYGVDSVVLLVHQDNWIFDGIWGTNWSNLYHQYHVHLCRFDKKNHINSLGTLYHEWMHCLDALIKTHTGVDINKYFKDTKCWVNWDSTCVHGNRYAGCVDTPYKYIKWKDNLDALAIIAPDLKAAYSVRKEAYLEPYKNVQRQVISWLRSFINRKTKITQ
jgi:hypothetical protein